MSDYTVSRILPTDKRAVRQMDALLEKEGITFKDDHHVDLKKHQWKIK